MFTVRSCGSPGFTAWIWRAGRSGRPESGSPAVEVRVPSGDVGRASQVLSEDMQMGRSHAGGDRELVGFFRPADGETEGEFARRLVEGMRTKRPKSDDGED